MSLFKANYSYKPKMLMTPRQAKKRSKIAEKRLETFMNLYIDFYKLIKLVQERIKKYYDFKKIWGTRS